MKKTAKIISMILALQLIFSTAAVGAFALDADPAEQNLESVAAEQIEDLDQAASEAANADEETAEEEPAPAPAPAAPAMIGAFPDYQSVTVRWQPAANATSYTVYRNDGAAWTTTATSYRDTAAAKDVTYSYYVTATGEGGTSAPSASAAGARVRTAYYYCTFKGSAKLKSHDGAKAKITFKKGQTVVAEGFSQGSFKFTGPNGRPYEAKWFRMKKVKGDYARNAYVNGYTAEAYVNNGGFASPTPYLIWINIYSQRVFIFTGSAGNWHLVNTGTDGGQGWLCGTGKAKFPTPTGMNKKLHKKMKKYSKHKWWNCFSGTNAIHGSNGKKELKKLGKMISNGCVRVTNDQAIWVFNNVPKKTRVIVF